MQQYKLNKISYYINSFVIIVAIIQAIITFVYDFNDNQKWEVWSMWYGFAIALYLFNYFYLTQKIIGEEFTLKKLALLFLVFMLGHFCLSYVWSFLVVKFYFERELNVEAAFYVSKLQTAFFYFLISTVTRVVKMFEKNQMIINDLEADEKMNQLRMIQSGIDSGLVSNYISFLQDRINEGEISEGIVELADFLRYTTYSGGEKRASFRDELVQLERFVSVLKKGGGVNVKIINEVDVNPLIPVFSLLTPLKELLIKFPMITEVEFNIVVKDAFISLGLNTNDKIDTESIFQTIIHNPQKAGEFKTSIEL